MIGPIDDQGGRAVFTISAPVFTFQKKSSIGALLLAAAISKERQGAEFEALREIARLLQNSEAPIKLLDAVENALAQASHGNPPRRVRATEALAIVKGVIEQK